MLWFLAHTSASPHTFVDQNGLPFPRDGFESPLTISCPFSPSCQNRSDLSKRDPAKKLWTMIFHRVAMTLRIYHRVAMTRRI